MNLACLKQDKGQENNNNTTRPADTTHAAERTNASKTRERDAIRDAPQLDVQDHGGEQGGAANLRNTNHATETHSDILKSKELGDGDETKKMTYTAPNTTDPNNVNNRQPILPTGDGSQATIAKTRYPGGRN